MVKEEHALIQKGKDDIAKEEWGKLLDEFIEIMISFLSANKHKPKFMPYLREKLNPTDKSDVFKDELIMPIKKYLSVIISKIFKLDINSEKMHFTLFTVIGQLYALIISKTGILEHLKIETINKDFVIKLKNNIISTIGLMAEINKKIFNAKVARVAI